MYRLIDRILGCLNDLLDGGMTAANNENNPVRRIDCQRDFLHFQVDAPGPVQQDEMESGRHFGRLGYPGEISSGPRGTKTKRVRRFSVEISHVRRKGLIALVEGAWQSRTEHPEVFLRRIDLHCRIDLQKVIQPARVVAMAMGDNGKIELPQVDALGLDIVREDLRVVASVEQDTLAAILDESRKSPVLRHRRGLAEGIVEYSDLRCARLCACFRGADRRGQCDYRRHLRDDLPSHRLAPGTVPHHVWPIGAKANLADFSLPRLPPRKDQHR